jgi:hypothetical protein
MRVRNGRCCPIFTRAVLISYASAQKADDNGCSEDPATESTGGGPEIGVNKQR